MYIHDIFIFIPFLDAKSKTLVPGALPTKEFPEKSIPEVLSEP